MIDRVLVRAVCESATKRGRSGGTRLARSSFMIRILATLALVAVIAGVAFVWSGRYNVAASSPESAPVAWALATTRDHSIARRSGAVVPRALDKVLAEAGAREYDEMCVTCHGAPGRKASGIGIGLNPAPPDLTDAALQTRYGDAQLFWIVKHGIKMSGMPAFGATHDDDQLWRVVAFVRRLVQMSPDEYAQWVRESEALAAHAEAAHVEPARISAIR
jgi:mono/diheme cytochrome c family protein